MSTTKHHPIKALATAAAVKVFVDEITARIKDGKISLDQLEAKAKAHNATAALAAIERLKIAKQNITQRLQDLKTAHKSNVSRAQADIDTDVATLKAEIDELGAKLKLQVSEK